MKNLWKGIAITAMWVSSIFLCSAAVDKWVVFSIVSLVFVGTLSVIVQEDKYQ